MSAAAEAIALGKQARKERHLAAAREHYAEAARLYRDQDDALACAHMLRHIADLHREELNLDEARPLYEESLEIYRSNLDTKLLDLANTVRPYALLQEQAGDHGLAEELWQEARNLYASLRVEAGVQECNAHLQSLRSR